MREVKTSSFQSLLINLSIDCFIVETQKEMRENREHNNVLRKSGMYDDERRKLSTAQIERNERYLAELLTLSRELGNDTITKINLI